MYSESHSLQKKLDYSYSTTFIPFLNQTSSPVLFLKNQNLFIRGVAGASYYQLEYSNSSINTEFQKQSFIFKEKLMDNVDAGEPVYRLQNKGAYRVQAFFFVSNETRLSNTVFYN